MRLEPEISTVSVVLVGSLNPAIFTPDWLARNEVISDDMAKEAEIGIIHNQLTEFRTDWLSIRVDQNRFQAMTTQGPFVRLGDTVSKIFRSLLPHTPLFQVGINREVHFNLASEEERDRIGHKLAPPMAWGEWGPKLVGGTGLQKGGVISITMQQKAELDRPLGHIQAKVEPSTQLAQPTGLFIQINDHFEVERKDTGAGPIITLMDENFDSSIRNSEWIIDQVLGLKDD